MALERTFAIVKPDAVKDGHIGEIIAAIEQSGLKIVGLKLTQLTRAICQGFYHEHVGKGFYPELEAFMTEGPVAIMVLEGENAILRWRDLMGATNPANADAGTIRKELAESIEANSVHGSDSEENAATEIAFFFKPEEIVG